MWTCSSRCAAGGKRIEFADESGGIFRALFLPQSVVVQAEAA